MSVTTITMRSTVRRIGTIVFPLSSTHASVNIKIPGFFFMVGAMPPEYDPNKVPSHHTPDFFIDDRAFINGLKAMLNVTVDYMYAK